MPSQRRLGSIIGHGGRNLAPSDFMEASTVEIDTAFGRLIGLTNGQKVKPNFEREEPIITIS